MPRFEINYLDNYTDESLLDEIRRVAAQSPGTSLSSDTFEQRSQRVSVSTIRRRFGGWQNALTKAATNRRNGDSLRAYDSSPLWWLAKRLNESWLGSPLQWPQGIREDEGTTCQAPYEGRSYCGHAACTFARWKGLPNSLRLQRTFGN